MVVVVVGMLMMRMVIIAFTPAVPYSFFYPIPNKKQQRGSSMRRKMKRRRKKNLHKLRYNNHNEEHEVFSLIEKVNHYACWCVSFEFLWKFFFHSTCLVLARKKIGENGLMRQKERSALKHTDVMIIINMYRCHKGTSTH